MASRTIRKPEALPTDEALPGLSWFEAGIARAEAEKRRPGPMCIGRGFLFGAGPTSRGARAWRREARLAADGNRPAVEFFPSAAEGRQQETADPRPAGLAG